MGDRCSIYLTIHGHIGSIEAMEQIIEALDDQCLSAEEHGTHAAAFLQAIESQNNPQFVDYECNYADISNTETVLQGHSIPYQARHDEGGGYGAGAWSWTPEHGRTEVGLICGDPAIDAQTLRKLIDGENPLEKIDKLIREAERADGTGLPEFSVSDEVRAWLTPKTETIPTDKRVACQNCNWHGHIDHVKPIQRLTERVAPGETMPAGECPACGALAHLDRQKAA